VTFDHPSVRARSVSDASATCIEASGHAPDALLSAALQIPRLVEVFVVHVALVVRSGAAVVAEQTLDVEELASGFLRADVFAGFVGFTVFDDGVREGLGLASVEVGAAGFGAEVGRVSGSDERDCRGLGNGLDAADWDDHDGRSHGDGDCCLVEEFGGSGRCKADIRGCGGGDVAGYVDRRYLGGSGDVQARASICQGCVVERDQ
jgi:hypothetical protein